jgi:Ca-activated chloride channel family protein
MRPARLHRGTEESALSHPAASPSFKAALAVCAALAVAPSALAQSGLLVPTSSGRPDPSVLSLREMAIDVGLARGYARVGVRQVFENHTSSIQEGTYRFRLPPSAAVGDFAVWDGLTRIPGVILEKRRARAIYRELTTQRIDPGLLQQGEEEDAEPGAARARSAAPSGGALFAVTIAPIPAFATKRLELQFQQEVPLSAGVGEFRLALRPPDGEPPTAATLRVRVHLEDGEFTPSEGALPLTREGDDLVFTGTDVRLDRHLVVRFAAKGAPALRVSAFRNPDGIVPETLKLAPWERPGEIPPEKDGFFLLEAYPPAESGARADAGTRDKPTRRAPVTLAILFDTSLSHRFAGLEAAYADLVRVLGELTQKDRFVLIAFDGSATVLGATQPVTREHVEAALQALRARPLGLGGDVAAALRAGRQAAGDKGRLLLLTGGTRGLQSKALTAARGPLPLYTLLSGEETPEALRAASQRLLPTGATQVESDLFFRRLTGSDEAAPAPVKAGAPAPFQVTGGDARIRDVYPVLLQPLAPASLSGFVGRYAVPQPRLDWEFASPLFKGGRARTEAALPERALEARDLPRRWARARVDHLLALIEAEGERREWVDEIIELSKRYGFVTPYTAFLAAPRSLLRPRRIQPGDPVLRVECDPGIVSAVALLPFGLRLPLERRPGTNLWEGRFLVPEGLKDGRYAVRIALRDASGARLSESKHFVIDGRAPRVSPEGPRTARSGAAVEVAARADEDVILLSARLGDGAPVPLRWDARQKRSVGTLVVPADLAGPQTLFFEAVDAAKNHGFARATLQVQP